MNHITIDHAKTTILNHNEMEFLTRSLFQIDAKDKIVFRGPICVPPDGSQDRLKLDHICDKVEGIEKPVMGSWYAKSDQLITIVSCERKRVAASTQIHEYFVGRCNNCTTTFIIRKLP